MLFKSFEALCAALPENWVSAPPPGVPLHCIDRLLNERKKYVICLIYYLESKLPSLYLKMIFWSLNDDYWLGYKSVSPFHLFNVARENQVFPNHVYNKRLHSHDSELDKRVELLLLIFKPRFLWSLPGLLVESCVNS